MTWTWDVLDSGELAVWDYTQDPTADAPAATNSYPEGLRWSPTGPAPYPNEVFDLMWQVAEGHYAETGIIDFQLVRYIAESAFEQIEQR